MLSRHFLFSALVLLGLLYLATSIPPIAHASASDDFVITVKTDNPGWSADTQFTIPTTGSGYNYNVDCDNDGNNEATAQTGNYTCSYGTAGTYTVRIKDNSGAGTGFPRIYFNYSGDRQKLMTIEQWGTGKWTSMVNAFAGCTNLAGQASDSPDLSNVTDTSNMFWGASVFNQNIGNWNTATVTDMSVMFENATAFNQNIGSWNTAKVTDMYSMFNGATSFNQPIGNWNTANVTDMDAMFMSASAFNQDVGNWNTANVTDMSVMFQDAAAFNQNIGNWNTANVIYTYRMFYGASAFNQNIGSWNTANVTDMTAMFRNASAFNRNIGSWNTGNVTGMSAMFSGASAFNQNIGSWNTGKVTFMSVMFEGASTFNQDIGHWNTAKVTAMGGMFSGANAFNRNIGGWNVGVLTFADNMFKGVTLSTTNYDALLNGWNAQTLHTGISFDGGNSQYCVGETARSHMISADSWTITDGGKHCPSTDLQIKKTVKKLSAISHKYTLKVQDLSTASAESLTITDKLPKHYRISKVTSKTANCLKSGRTVTCTLAQLNPGATLAITILAAPNGAVGKNCATVQVGTTDPNSANNKSCVKVP